MAKSDSFFIRGLTTAPGGSYVENAIDIGHVVDALGKTVMRIHNVQAQLWEGIIGNDFSITSNLSLIHI